MTTETQKLEEMEDFLEYILTQFYDEEEEYAEDLIIELILSLPEDINWLGLWLDKDEYGFGEYVTNPKTLKLTDKEIEARFEKGKYSIFDPNQDKDFEDWLKQNNTGFTRASVMKYCSSKFKPEQLPGLETHKWLHKNPLNEAPKNLKDGGCYYLPGAILRDKDGVWSLQFCTWDPDPKYDLYLFDFISPVDSWWNSNEYVLVFT